jgi:hypothetical protein
MTNEPIENSESVETRNRLPKSLGDRIREVINFDPVSGLEAIKHLKDFDLKKSQKELGDKLDDFIWEKFKRGIVKREFKDAGFSDPEKGVKVVDYMRKNCLIK